MRFTVLGIWSFGLEIVYEYGLISEISHLLSTLFEALLSLSSICSRDMSAARHQTECSRRLRQTYDSGHWDSCIIVHKRLTRNVRRWIVSLHATCSGAAEE